MCLVVMHVAWPEILGENLRMAAALAQARLKANALGNGKNSSANVPCRPCSATGEMLRHGYHIKCRRCNGAGHVKMLVLNYMNPHQRKPDARRAERS